MKLEELELLQKQLTAVSSTLEKIAILDRLPPVQKLAQPGNYFSLFIEHLPPESKCAMKQLAAIGQVIDPQIDSMEKWQGLLQISLDIDRFYREIGGVIGYQVCILQLLKRINLDPFDESTRFHSPSFEDISEPTESVQDSIRSGLEALPFLAELYPLGGAADRLHLVDEGTGLELPAARLMFAGRPLLETLIRDLQAREWLYYRQYGRQIETPIAIMTSHEKDNHRHVLKICEECGWFGRSKDSFRFFIQPLVPTVDENGHWHKIGPLKPYLKPGGHGTIWKLARDQGVFAWLKSRGIKKTLVRQINNPIAGLDYGLLSFIGIGYARNMAFGFVSCNRLIKAAEGVLVVKEKEGRIVLTNIEYCDFAKFGIEDVPLRPEEPYSRFTSNTNLLFADLDAVEIAVRSLPFPGLLMNLKPASILDEGGRKKEVLVARLESTMQNIADAFDEPKAEGIALKKTFVTYNRRHKTISVAKKAYVPGKSTLETPEQCFYELLQSNRELLSECGFLLPQASSQEEYLAQGPDVLFLYHPALGPLYSMIREKLRGGQIAKGSEWIAEIAELDVANLSIDGSLRIKALNLIGSYDPQNILRYSTHVGQCVLEDVIIRNRGVDWKKSGSFWRMQLQRNESLEIELQGWSVFDAKGVTFEGSHKFVVKEGIRMIVRQKDGQITIVEEAVD